jgi:hypothetical protein
MLPFKPIVWMREEQVQLTLNISGQELRNLSESGKIPYEDLCENYFYKSKDVSRFLKKQKKAKYRSSPRKYFSWRKWPSSMN